jgi:uncharacterized protein YaaQ
MGVKNERLPAITGIIEATCHTRTRLMNAAPYPGMAGAYGIGTVAPVEVLVGGAVVFGLPVERFLRLGGGSASTPADLVSSKLPWAKTVELSVQADVTERMSNMTPGGDAGAHVAAHLATDPEGAAPVAAAPGTRLVVAIVQKENTEAVVNSLMGAGYRLTRVDTAGGFMRRGNATLLIGVEALRLNDVLALIQANCRPRTEPAPIQEGMPMYGATVFVLNASHFLRF